MRVSHEHWLKSVEIFNGLIIFFCALILYNFVYFNILFLFFLVGEELCSSAITGYTEGIYTRSSDFNVGTFFRDFNTIFIFIVGTLNTKKEAPVKFVDEKKN